MKTSYRGLNLIKKWEGLRLEAYPDPATGGEPWTIGYGITTAAGLGRIVKGMKITRDQANEMLVTALGKYENAVSRALKRNPNQNQFDAMVSLCWNIGPGAFQKSSVVKHFNAGDEAKAAASILFFNKAAGKVMPGLVNRRREEMALFTTPAPGLVGASMVADPLRVKKKPVLQHRRVWTGITAWLGGGGAMAFGAFQGFDWLALLVLLAFVSAWAAFFWFIYRREIKAGMFTAEDK